MSCAKDPSIERMRADLLGGGWTPSHGGTVWTTPAGTAYRGPHKAWHVWAGEEMDTDQPAIIHLKPLIDDEYQPSGR